MKKPIVPGYSLGRFFMFGGGGGAVVLCDQFKEGASAAARSPFLDLITQEHVKKVFHPA
jgi:hypothetical protein